MFFRLRNIRDAQLTIHHGDYELTGEITAVVDANVRRGECPFQANGSNRDDSNVIPAETISEVTPGSSYIERNCNIFDAVTNEDHAGYLIPAEAMCEMSRNKQPYEALDVLRRNNDEHEYQSLERISDVDGSNENHGYVIPAETIVIPCSSNIERNCEVFDAVTNEDQAGYLFPAEAMSEMSPNKQHYEALDVSRRTEDDEHKYQSLVRISDVDGSEENHDYVIPAETTLELTP